MPRRTAPSAAPISPDRRKNSGFGGLILPVVIAVALFVILVVVATQRDGLRPIAGTDRSETQAPAEKAEKTDATETTAAAEPEASGGDTTRTTIASLDAAFRDDPQGARARYAGRITASGTVAGVTPGSSPALSLEGRTPFNFVVANVADAAQLAGIAKGSRVTITCDGVTALAGTTILRGCVIEG
ncbi:MAG: hypothetical protein PGN21_16040 [Sphingomonas paucimobilis]